MMKSSWGLLKTAVGGSALGMLIYKAKTGKSDSVAFDYSLWSLEVVGQLLLLTAGVMAITKKNYLVGLSLVLLALYSLVFGIFWTGQIGYTTISAFDNAVFYPLVVSNAVLFLMGARKLMARS